MNLRNLIGRERPYDYPDNLHFTNKKRRFFDKLDSKNFHTSLDFQPSYMVQQDTEFGSLEFVKNNSKSLMLGLAFVTIVYMYNKSKV